MKPSTETQPGIEEWYEGMSGVSPAYPLLRDVIPLETALLLLS
jgi:hypothetical protein